MVVPTADALPVLSASSGRDVFSISFFMISKLWWELGILKYKSEATSFLVISWLQFYDDDYSIILFKARALLLVNNQPNQADSGHINQTTKSGRAPLLLDPPRRDPGPLKLNLNHSSRWPFSRPYCLRIRFGTHPDDAAWRQSSVGFNHAAARPAAFK
jgi:hypothetical protein